MFNFYLAYCDHQRALGQPIPSYEWWCMACKRSADRSVQLATYSEVERQLAADQREIDRERSEGWTYAER